jgi:hypothetical protein
VSYFRNLCLFPYSDVQHIMFCVLFSLVFVVLYKICCQFLWIAILIAPSVFSNVSLYDEIKKSDRSATHVHPT